MNNLPRFDRQGQTVASNLASYEIFVCAAGTGGPGEAACSVEPAEGDAVMDDLNNGGAPESSPARYAEVRAAVRRRCVRDWRLTIARPSRASPLACERARARGRVWRCTSGRLRSCSRSRSCSPCSSCSAATAAAAPTAARVAVGAGTLNRPPSLAACGAALTSTRGGTRAAAGH